MVTSKGVDAKELGPAIKSISVDKPRERIGITESVTIRANIEHPSGIEKAEVAIQRDSGGAFIAQNGAMSKKPSAVNTYEYELKTIDIGQGRYLEAGKYSGLVTAISKDGKTSRFPFEFELLRPTVSKPNLIGTKEEDPTTIDGQRLRVESAEQFKKMKAAAKKENIDLTIVSGYRTFDDQVGIWNGKFDDNIRFPGTEDQKVKKIVEFSAVPGMSRHHWGTEIDINSLEPDDFAENGKEAKTYAWLKENAIKFGFCQPYDGTSKIVEKEPWHWSYKPLSKYFTEEYKKEITEDNLKPELTKKNVKGRDIILSNFDTYKKGFISDINSECT